MANSWFSDASSTGMPTWARRTGVVVAALAGLFAAVAAAAHLVVDASFLESRLNQRLTESTNGLYEAEIGSVDLSFLLQSVEIGDITVRPDSAEIARLHRTDSLPDTRFSVDLSALSLNDIGYWTLIRRGGLQLDSLIARTPDVTITTSSNEPQSTRQDSARRSLTARIHEALPYVSMDRLGIREGTVSMKGGRSGTIEGLSLTLENLDIDSTALQDTSRVLFSRSLEVSIDTYERGMIDSLYSFQIRSLHGTSRDRSMQISSVTVKPTQPDSIFVRRLPERDPRYDVDIGPISMQAVDYRALAEQQAVDIRTVTLDSMLFDLYLDRRVPEVPEPPPPMPHDIIDNITFPLAIDTLRIPEGAVHYTLDVQDTPRQARLTFDLLPSRITNITNNPDEMSPDSPAVVRTGAFINDAGPLYTTMTIPLLTPDLSMEFTGAMAPFDPGALNEVLFPMRSTRITSGAVDTLWFHATVDNGLASGEFHAIYSNLSLEIANQNGGGQDVPDQLKTFLLNRAVLNQSNLPSDADSLRVGVIRHQHNPENPFFKFLWKSVQTGIFSLIGL